MTCIQLATNAYLEALQMPAGVPNTIGIWLKRAALTSFGDLYMSETSTPNDAAGDLIAGIGSSAFFVVRKFDGQSTGGTPSSDTWYFCVASSEDGGNHRLRVFADDAPTMTKIVDLTYAASVTDKRFAAVVAPDSALKCTAMFLHYGASATDADWRSQAITRTPLTPSVGTMWAAFALDDHTIMDDLLGSNDLLNGGTLSTVADEPTSLSYSSGVFSFARGIARGTIR